MTNGTTILVVLGVAAAGFLVDNVTGFFSSIGSQTLRNLSPTPDSRPADFQA